MAERSSLNVILSLPHPIQGEAPLDVMLPEVLEIVATGFSGSSFAEITFLERHSLAATLATSQVGIDIGTIPFHARGGPRLDAHRRQAASRIDSTAADGRWPEFCRDAIAAGVHSVLSLPLVVAGDGIGALTLYVPTAFGFGIRDERVGSIFASLLSGILARALRGRAGIGANQLS